MKTIFRLYIDNYLCRLCIRTGRHIGIIILWLQCQRHIMLILNLLISNQTYLLWRLMVLLTIFVISWRLSFIFAEATGIPLQTTDILQATETFYLITLANFGGDRYWLYGYIYKLYNTHFHNLLNFIGYFIILEIDLFKLPWWCPSN